MLDSDVVDLCEFPLGVVAHDAGAANHIFEWLRKFEDKKVHYCLEGPAERIWDQIPYARPCSNEDLSRVVERSKMLLTGTGWASNLEHNARKLARSAGLKSVAVIDHWANYRERFFRGGEEVLPDEIWVTDEYAERLAVLAYPNLKVMLLPNAYLDRLVQEVRVHERGLAKRTVCNLLYVLEPIRERWGCDNQPGEFQALDFLVKNLNLIHPGSNLSIKLRPHPSDPIGKYDQWLEAQKNVQMALDESPSLAESIACADVVVGCNTYAMVVALAAGRRVISSLPPWAPSCILPQAGILTLKDLRHLTI